MDDGAVGSEETSIASGDHGLTARRTGLVEQIRRVARSVQAAMAELSEQAGLNQSDFQALVRIVAADGMTGAEVARVLGVSSSSMTELADRLQRAGLIARTRSSSDRRLVVLRPTARGRRTIERVLAPLLAGIAGAVQTLGEDQLVVVGSFLGDVERALAAIAAR